MTTPNANEAKRTEPLGSRHHPVTIRRKLGCVFALSALCFVVLLATALYQISCVQNDTLKLLEESKEVAIAHDASVVFASITTAIKDPRSATDASATARVHELLKDARVRIDELISEQERPDPSDPSHQETEDDLVEQIRASLEEAQRSIDGGESATGTLENVQRLTSVILEEMRAESKRAHHDLERRLSRVGTALQLASIGAAISLLLSFWILHGSVVVPMRVLAEGARTFTQGDFDHRIRIRSRDEFGDLARQFNEMAARIGENRDLLEETVRKRTRDFIEAAKFAGLGTLATGVAHEVNTPIASIASCAEGLERRIRAGDIDENEQFEYLQTIASEAYRVHDITSRLLALARQDPGPKSLLNIVPILQETELMMRHRAEQFGIDLQVVHDDGPTWIRCNAAELKQVLINLASNAIDASQRGQSIKLRARQTETTVVLEVEDDGHGIPKEDLQRVFEPFFTSKPQGRGTGLGLALVYSIVEQSDGSIEIIDKDGPGTIVRVRLPRVVEAT